MSIIECLKDIGTVVGVLIALATLILGFCEYKRQGVQRRAEQFIEIRKRFKENEIFREISALLEDDDPKLIRELYKNKRDYLGFFEEIALLVNSDLIEVHVAYYMFGYYAIKCWKSKNFWKNINRESQYWMLFKEFAAKMKKIEDNFVYEERKLRF